jgi:hypothetical protein
MGTFLYYVMLYSGIFDPLPPLRNAKPYKCLLQCKVLSLGPLKIKLWLELILERHSAALPLT